MKYFLLAALLCFSSNSMASRIPRNMDIVVQPTKTAKLRKYSDLENKKVLVTDTILPAGTVINVEVDSPLMYQWVQNDRGQTFQTSFPYFNSKIKNIPDDFALPPLERERILSTTFQIQIMDLNPSQIVSTLYPQTLPDGVDKVDVSLPWDSFNPNGTWAYAVQKGLDHQLNKTLVNNPPRDILDFCPRFDSLEKKDKMNFWILLLAHIADWESRFVPLTASDEGIFDSDKKGVISSGLMQISLLSVQSSCYQARGCNLIRNQNDLFDPNRNLQCTLGVMSCLSENAGCISCKKDGRWRGIAQYWSTLQTAREVPCAICPGGKAIIGKKQEIQTSLKTSAPFCF